MENKTTDLTQSISSFMAGYSCETTPTSAAKVERFRDHLSEGTAVYVTSLPGEDLGDIVKTVVRLKGEGLVPVPHISARAMPNAAVLEEHLEQLVSEADIKQVLLIGGGLDKPVGDFSDTMQMLDTGLFDKHGISKIDVAGHPEGSPDITDEGILEALAWKNGFAERTGADMQIVTQFCFEVAPIIAWDKAIQADGNKIPIRIGLPGLATIKTLLMYAKACGVGPSMRFVTRQARNITKLLVVSAPHELVRDLADYKATDPACGIESVHMFPLGGLKRTAAWSNAVVAGDFTLESKGGFSVKTD